MWINPHKTKKSNERSDVWECVLYAENIFVHPPAHLTAAIVPSLDGKWEYVGNADETYMKTRIITAR